MYYLVFELQPDLMVHNSEWTLLDITKERNVAYYPCCPEAYIDVTYNLTLKRESPNYIAVVGTPTTGNWNDQSSIHFMVHVMVVYSHRLPHPGHFLASTTVRRQDNHRGVHNDIDIIVSDLFQPNFTTDTVQHASDRWVINQRLVFQNFIQKTSSFMIFHDEETNDDVTILSLWNIVDFEVSAMFISTSWKLYPKKKNSCSNFLEYSFDDVLVMLSVHWLQNSVWFSSGFLTWSLTVSFKFTCLKFSTYFSTVHFYSCSLYLVSISLIISLIVINMSKRSSTRPLPWRFNHFLTGWLGKILWLDDMVQLVSSSCRIQKQ